MASIYANNTGSFKLLGLSDSSELVSSAKPDLRHRRQARRGAVAGSRHGRGRPEPRAYRGIIRAATPLVDGKQYFIKVDVVVVGIMAHYELHLRLEFDQHPVAAQLAAICIEQMIGEAKLHRAPPEALRGGIITRFSCANQADLKVFAAGLCQCRRC